jgi:ABC-2 type transport system permease protein
VKQAHIIALQTIIIKETQRFLRIWVQTIVPPAVTTALYFIIFGQLIGSRIGNIGGVSYIQFIVPGLIMMTVIMNSYSNVSGSFFITKLQHSVEELLVSSAPNYIILLGYLIGGVMRGLAVSFVVALVALCFTHLYVQHLWVVLVTVVLVSSIFSLAGLINAIYAKTFDHISFVPTFILTPLTYLAGIFYSISMLPVFWQKVSLFNPIFYMVNTMRYGILGVSDVSVSAGLVFMVLFNAVLFAYAWRLLSKGVGLKT